MWFYWVCLLGSILFEVAATSIMKLSQGTEWPLVGMGVMYVLLGLSYFCLAKAVVRLPIGVAYAFWEGIGLVLITLVSFFLVGEHLSPMRILALCMVFAGTMLIHHGTESSEADPAKTLAESAAGGT